MAVRYQRVRILVLLLAIALGAASPAAGQSNGQLPKSQLAPIPSSAQAAKPAAAAFNTARFCAAKQGIDLYVGGSNSGYRLRGIPSDWPPPRYGTQWYFWGAFQARQGNLAAYPGTSNHGYGKAFDLGQPRMRAWIDRYGGAFFIRKIEAFSEWWHVNYTGPGRFSQPDPGGTLSQPILSRGSGGNSTAGRCLKAAVKDLQKRLGIKRTGYFGTQTVKAVRLLQKRAGLRVDGLVGPASWTAVRRIGPANGGSRVLRVVKPAMTGQDVRAAQQLLNSRFRELMRPSSWTVRVTGAYDRQTAKGVRRFQVGRGYKKTGVVDKATLRGLRRPAQTTRQEVQRATVVAGVKE